MTAYRIAPGYAIAPPPREALRDWANLVRKVVDNAAAARLGVGDRQDAVALLGWLEGVIDLTAPSANYYSDGQRPAFEAPPPPSSLGMEPHVRHLLADDKEAPLATLCGRQWEAPPRWTGPPPAGFSVALCEDCDRLAGQLAPGVWLQPYAKKVRREEK